MLGKKCQATLPPSLNTSPAAIRLCAYLWTHQYTHLSPSTCFVLDDGTGRAVGYCIGFPDVDAFVASYDDYVTGVLDQTPDEVISRPENMSTAEPWVVPIEDDDDGIAAREVKGKATTTTTTTTTTVNGTRLAQMAYSADWLVVSENKVVLADGYRAQMHIDLLEPWQGKGWGRKLVETFAASLKGKRSEGCKGIFLGIAPDNTKVVPFYQKCGFELYDQGNGSVCMVRRLD